MTALISFVLVVVALSGMTLWTLSLGLRRLRGRGRIRASVLVSLCAFAWSLGLFVLLPDSLLRDLVARVVVVAIVYPVGVVLVLGWSEESRRRAAQQKAEAAAFLAPVYRQNLQDVVQLRRIALAIRADTGPVAPAVLDELRKMCFSLDKELDRLVSVLSQALSAPHSGDEIESLAARIVDRSEYVERSLSDWMHRLQSPDD